MIIKTVIFKAGEAKRWKRKWSFHFPSKCKNIGAGGLWPTSHAGQNPERPVSALRGYLPKWDTQVEVGC